MQDNIKTLLILIIIFVFLMAGLQIKKIIDELTELKLDKASWDIVYCLDKYPDKSMWCLAQRDRLMRRSNHVK